MHGKSPKLLDWENHSACDEENLFMQLSQQTFGHKNILECSVQLERKFTECLAFLSLVSYQR